ncbi:hypothetical protein BFG57_11510 [Bacillus solimangrovi]|uniref:carbonic anhydrase n=1 Tax=Bacillus solimangrovi TaxID=1305675 RepID=A0A1E5LI92_9BACI|nr:hypothetical protein BFG57_11510 [Bacillus solimangrovi]
MLGEILDYNKLFVSRQKYKKYVLDKKPNKEIVIISCMDARLTELLPHALNMKNSDYVSITTAGAMIPHLFDSIMKSLIVAISQFDVKEILVIGHSDCGMDCLKTNDIYEQTNDVSFPEDFTDKYKSFLLNWLDGFNSYEENIISSMNMLKSHPLVPENILVHGLLINPETGELTLVASGEKH